MIHRSLQNTIIQCNKSIKVN